MIMNAPPAQICLVIGDPIAHSRSPLIHHAAYQALGLQNKYFFSAARVPAVELKAAVAGMRALGIRGMACTIPHKQALLTLVDRLDEEARLTGAVNTLVQENGIITGYNTDIVGVRDPLKARVSLRDKKVLVIGAGGAARAAARAVTGEGAKLFISNRTTVHAEKFAADFAGSMYAEHHLPEIEIIINATSLGMHPNVDELPFESSALKGKLVFDLVYNPPQTKFLQQAKNNGAETISGQEMFLAQAAKQFELFTGQAAPLEVMRNALQEIS
jgi:shikimate dehydrogenase